MGGVQRPLAQVGQPWPRHLALPEERAPFPFMAHAPTQALVAPTELFGQAPVLIGDARERSLVVPLASPDGGGEVPDADAQVRLAPPRGGIGGPFALLRRSTLNCCRADLIRIFVFSTFFNVFDVFFVFACSCVFGRSRGAYSCTYLGVYVFSLLPTVGGGPRG